MSSGFVPAGTILPDTHSVSNPEDAAWAAARAAVSSSGSTTTSTSVSATDPSDTRSLFEILQANKTRKQEEFAEKLKFKNQFRMLDEDDVEFLDSVMEGQKRLDEERRRKEREEVEKFKELQFAGDAGNVEEVIGKEEEEEEVKWGKRKRGEKRGRAMVTALAGAKVKRKEDAEEGTAKQDGTDGDHEEKALDVKKRKVEKVETNQTTAAEKPAEKAAPVPKVGPPKVALGLDYGSGSDDD